jgi:AcrR family transcriptional regulator
VRGQAHGEPRPARAQPARRDGRPSNGSVPAPEGVIGIQRARILAAITELVREQGVASITVAHVVARSGVSRRTFYDLFTDRDDCLLAAFEQALERAAGVVLPAYGAAGAWEQRLRAGLGALLGFLDAEPAMGGLLVVDALAAERSLLERRARVVQALIGAVNQGAARPRGGPGRRPARIVAEGTVGAVLAIVHARLSARDPKPLAGLLNQLMGMIVLPYCGAEAAARELERSVPKPRKRPPPPPADPLRDLGMRLTYRTVRVLLAIAEQPGASSRAVADASDIADQGQMSKLLWRLDHLGLIANGIERHGRGEPNAWSLTPRGEQVQRAIRAQTGR